MMFYCLRRCPLSCLPVREQAINYILNLLDGIPFGEEVTETLDFLFLFILIGLFTLGYDFINHIYRQFAILFHFFKPCRLG